MAITYNALSGSDFDPLEATGEAWTKLAMVLESEAGTLADQKRSDGAGLGVDHWEGTAADAGRERLGELVVDVDDRAGSARRIGAAMADAAEAFKACQSDLDDVLAEIDRERAHVSESGAVIPDTSSGTDNIEYASSMSARIQSVLDTATETDEGLKAAIAVYAETLSDAERSDLADRALGPADDLQEIVQDGAGPGRINDWWESLDQSEQLALLETNPELIAGLDGIPTDFRDSANRDLLETEIDRFDPGLDGEIAELEERLEELSGDDSHLAWEDYEGAEGSAEHLALIQEFQELEAERDRRDALTGLQEAIAGPAPSGQEHFLLGYDSADDGKAIVAVGNPDTADNTAVYVPGTGADLDGVGNEIDRAGTMALDSQEYGTGEDTAVVAWLDYDAPDEVVPDAMVMSYAEDAGPDLSRFTEGLDVTHQGDGHTTLLGHSYGTTVVGHTATEHGVEADKIIAVASPGMDNRSAEDLGVGAENVYATTAEGDAIRKSTDTYGWGEFVLDSISGTEHAPDDQGDGYYAWHGNTNPVHESYGATEFASEATDKHGNETDDGVAIHSGYWAEGNVARENMAFIITDQTDRVTPSEGSSS